MRRILLIIATFFVTISSDYAQSQDSDLVRIPPMLPHNAEESGFCCIRLDVSKKGKPKNVEAYSCTHEVYKKSAEKTVKRWRYHPLYVDGKRQSRKNILNKVTYHLTDEDGSLLYDPEIYIPRRVDPNKPDGWSIITCDKD